MYAQDLLALLIFAYSRPSQTPGERRMETFNEVILAGVLYTMICFSPLVPNIETKMKVGWVTCLLVMFHFAFSISRIIMSSCSTCKRSVKKHNFRRSHNKGRKALKMRFRGGVLAWKENRDIKSSVPMPGPLPVPSREEVIAKMFGLSKIVDESSQQVSSSAKSINSEASE